VKAQHIVGKRVARVVQTWINDGEHTAHWEIDRIEFADGSYIYFAAHEHVGDYGVSVHYWPKKDGAK